MANAVKERLFALRKQMAEKGVDFYIVSSSDFHGSEYIGDFFKAVKYITGFTGSAGTAVITQEEAGLWTDGRYFIQANMQLSGSGILLRRMGEEGVPSIEEYIKANLKEGGCIGFDGRVVSAEKAEAYQKIAEEKHGTVFSKEDLIGTVWTDRPKMPKEPFFILEEKFSGQSTKDKFLAVREKMKQAGADVHILAALEDIAWLLNVRGRDIAHVPVVMSYLVVRMETCVWYLQEEILTKEQREYLEENHIVTKPYEEIYHDMASFSAEGALYNGRNVNYRIIGSLPDRVKKIDQANPTELLKAVKNPIEIKNTINAHIKDGVAFTKFMYWLKTNIGREQITEISASDYLEARRREQEHFLDLSFQTISAYGANAAMMHYEATKEHDAVLEPVGFLLVDSGGHYLEGTTDITRTMALGPITEEMRRNFTAVVRSNLNLASAKFLYGCRGLNLDILAREPLWSMGIDYKCGTGHGVGYALNVHEGPNAFRYKQGKGAQETAVFEEGMVTTDEPGVYIEGAYGIRIENELVCRKAEKNEYGQFMCFETITYAPIDLDAIDAEELTKKEKMFLNGYHKKVYDTLSPYMTDEENRWLKEYTRTI